MACCPKSVIAEILKAKGTIKNVYYVACGGSYAGLHPGKYFLESEAKELRVDHYTSNEFVHATPKSLDANSIVITQSASGNTPETVKAAEIAQKVGAASIVITNKDDSPLAKNGDYVLVPKRGEAANSGSAYSLKLAVEILNQVEGYENYDEMYNGFDRLDKILAWGKEAFEARTTRWAKMYKDEKIIYTMGSGSAHSVAYSFAICLLMEMQWIHSSGIHSGEYFHGPFEITDRETPFIVLMSEGRTRALDQRALDFLKQYAEKLMIVDVKELGINTIDNSVVEFFNPLVINPALRMFASKLADERKHPLSVRRYMWKLEY